MAVLNDNPSTMNWNFARIEKNKSKCILKNTKNLQKKSNQYFEIERIICYDDYGNEKGLCSSGSVPWRWRKLNIELSNHIYNYINEYENMNVIKIWLVIRKLHYQCFKLHLG